MGKKPVLKAGIGETEPQIFQDPHIRSQGKWQNPFGRQMLDSVKEGKFEKFFLLDREKVKPIPDRVIKWQAQFKQPEKQVEKQLNTLF